MPDEFDGIDLGIEESPGEGEDNETSGTQEAQVESGDGQASQQGQATESGQQTTGTTGETQPTGDQQQPTGQQQGQPASTTEGQQDAGQRIVKSDSQGNLVDGQGNVVAKAGAERRLYEKASDLTEKVRQSSGYIQQLQQQNEQLKQQMTTQQALNGMPQQLGLSDTDAVMGMRLISSFRKDPAATIKYILTEAKAMGHNLDVEGMSSQVDMGAIARMIEQHTAPLRQNHEQQQEAERAQQEALQTYNAFVNNPNHPYAQIHENEIARLYQADPSLSLEAAYYKLQSWAYANGLDFRQPLMPQMQARQQQPQPAQQQSAQARSGTAPLVPGGGNAQPQEQEAVYADPDESYESIIRKAMQGISS